MATYTYPEARELREITPNLVVDLTKNDITFQIMPIRTASAAMIQWTIDDDDYGLQQLRGLDGAPTHVIPTGRNSFTVEPGYYGEFETITEKELTEAGGSIIGEATVDVSQLAMNRVRQLVGRELTRIRYIIWTLLTTGTFSVSGKGGTVVHTDTFTVQTYDASTWGTPSSATPLADFRGVQQLGSQYGVGFGGSSLAVMNRVTANKMLANTNANDLGGKRTVGGGTINSLSEVGKIINGDDLPQIVVFDNGYKDDSKTFTKFIPDNKVVVVGTRAPGDIIGEYRMTRNLNNPNGAPGSYDYIKDYAQGINAPKETPPRIELHRGHNGGPVLYRPSAFVVMDVS